MCRLEDRLARQLDKRNKEGNLRVLKSESGKIDFVSNDYLSLARNQTIYEIVKSQMEDLDDQPYRNGAGASRLLSGNSPVYEETEIYLSKIFKSEACLLFNSGYLANLGLVSSVPQKGDTIIYDQLSHICLKEGAWLSTAESVKFAHNDLVDLEKKLKNARGEKFIIAESIYSMDGDFLPLAEIVSLAKKHQANIILDEAHSTGSYGNNGEGWAVSLGVEKDIFARVHTFGKAMGIHGACVAGSQVLKDYLINFGRSFVYTTAMSLHSVLAIRESFQYLGRNAWELQEKLHLNIAHFKSEFKRIFDLSSTIIKYIESSTAIQPIIISGNNRVKKVAKKLSEQGFDVRAILSPTVQSGTERLRISLHVHNTTEEITSLLESLNELTKNG